MKKFGFTLAEMLITLSVVGIVSALTLPMFVMNTQYKTYAAKLSATITALETAFSNIIVDEENENIHDIENWYNEEKIGKFIKFLVHEKDVAVDGQILSKEAYPDLKENDIFAKTIDDEVYLDETIENSIKSAFTLKNGNTIFIMDNNKVIIDVAKGKPNIVGRDIFVFYLEEDGKLYPYGSKYLTTINSDYEYWKDSRDIDYACNDTKKGAGCTARLVENNFVIDF